MSTHTLTHPHSTTSSQICHHQHYCRYFHNHYSRFRFEFIKQQNEPDDSSSAKSSESRQSRHLSAIHPPQLSFNHRGFLADR